MQNFNSFLLLARNRRVSETITDQAWAVKYMLCRQSQAVSTVSGMCLLWSQRILSKVGHRAVTESVEYPTSRTHSVMSTRLIALITCQLFKLNGNAAARLQSWCFRLGHAHKECLHFSTSFCPFGIQLQHENYTLTQEISISVNSSLTCSII